VGDAPDYVTVNLKVIKETLGANHLIFTNQSHGPDILVLRKGRYEGLKNVPSADAIITDIPFFALMVQLADCQGVILFDPKKNVIANVHCGWRGNVQNILERVVIRMKKDFGCRESNLLAGISPSLGPCCAEFVSHREIFPDAFEQFMVRENYFDLWAVSRWQLESAGLRRDHIEIAGICTRCRSDLFYSYRGEGKTGRFGAVAMLT
jgi:YfiH family protein